MNSHKSDCNTWSIIYDHYDPADEGRREAVLALGNGVLMSRAAAPESIGNGAHYPGTYRVGCYNRLRTNIQGEEVENESLVNLPNWLSLSFRIEQGRWFSLDEVEILEYRQELNMEEAVLYRNVTFRDEEGRKSSLRERRFISMAQPHLLALEVELSPQNWSGEVEVFSALDGRVLNNNVRRYAPYNSRHLKTVFTGRAGEELLELRAKTVQSGIEIALCARTRLYQGKNTPAYERKLDKEKDRVGDRLQLSLKAGEPVRMEKIAALYTSRDLAIAECREAARQAVEQMEGFEALLLPHRKAWAQLWRRSRISLKPQKHLRLFRFHIFQILQNLSPHTADLDVGVPPNGWQGEEYHGQIFWDELFVLQFLTFRFPAIARSALLYRFRRLNQARRLAKEHGFRGAMFPWRSASSGREETPKYQLNLYSGRWIKDHTYLQRHISAVIAFNVCHYVEVTGDTLFLEDYGAELLLEIARFWASKAKYNPEYDRYEIKEVVGPDEYHTCYPGSTKPGIDNNTYTNVMAVWALFQARRYFEKVSPQRRQELWEVLGLSHEELDHWDEVSRKMRIVFQEEGILSQFEGFSSLRKLDLRQFRHQHGEERIDWALEAIGDSVERYQVSKQADTSLLLYLFSPEEMMALLKRLGYSMDPEGLRRTVHYHRSHTVHESSLSRIVYAGALAQLDPETSWELFEKAQLIDLIPGEHADSSEGIHLGAMGGTLVILQYFYLGIRIQSGVLTLNPAFPEKLEKVKITLFFRGVELEFEVNHRRVRITSVHPNVVSIQVGHGGETKELNAGSSVSFDF